MKTILTKICHPKNDWNEFKKFVSSYSGVGFDRLSFVGKGIVLIIITLVLIIFLYAGASAISGLKNILMPATPLLSDGILKNPVEVTYPNFEEWTIDEGIVVHAEDLNQNNVGLDISLSTSTTDAMVHNPHDIPTNTSIDIDFLSFGDLAINLSILMDNLYNVVVGDGDYRVITLKTPPEGGIGEWIFQKETSTQKERAPTNFTISPGKPVAVRVTQRKYDDGTFLILVTTKYKPTQVANADPEPPVTHSFSFTPTINPPKHYLSIGLTDPSKKHDPRVWIQSVDINK